jgi:hypothetical protein
MKTILRPTNGVVADSVATVKIPSAYVKALRANPFPLVPAINVATDQGSQSIIGEWPSTTANYVIVPDAYSIQLIYAGTAYTNANTAIQLMLGTVAVTASIATPAIFLATANRLQLFEGASQATAADPVTMINQPLTLANTGTAELLAGNSDIIVNVWYSVLKV